MTRALPLPVVARRATLRAMALHLLKLSVGSRSLDALRGWVERSSAASVAAGGRRGARITTRMAPRRLDEVLAGGSLYWVVKGTLQARQPILAFEPFKDDSGVARYHVLLDPQVVSVRPRPCRPFQGWRYLRPEDAPADWDASGLDDDIPASMRRELMELCLI
ncbi:MAG: DUF1489 domain-containing protein [Pseudomonadota bacterium]